MERIHKLNKTTARIEIGEAVLVLEMRVLARIVAGRVGLAMDQ